MNEIWKTFEIKLKQLMEKHIPSKMLSGNKINKPWINKDFKSHIRRRNKLYLRQKVSHKAEDRTKHLKVKTDTQRLERQS